MTRPTGSPTHDFFGTCPRNTEGLLLDELRSVGAADATETRAGVAFRGTLPLAYRACLWSRVASRVLLRLASFSASSPDDLYEGVHRLAWEEHMGAGGTLAVEVTTTVRQGPLAQLNTHFAEQRVKDAVVDRFREREGTRPGVDLARPDIRINVHLTPTETIVSLDLSGEGLHRRGYRLEGGEAPLKENLAAAILLRAGWPRIAAAGGALIDPMCGSGTLLIEGALMAADVAPGLLREYWGFAGWKGFDPLPWAELVAEARERRSEGLRRLPSIFGSDTDARVLGTARANAQRAGLAGRIVLERREIADLARPAAAAQPAAAARPAVVVRPASAAGPTMPSAEAAPLPDPGQNARGSDPFLGLVIANPPYGKRLGEVSELADVYETLGERLKESFPGWQAAIFTGNPELGAHLGLRAHRVNVLYNGPLLCKLLTFKIGPGFGDDGLACAHGGHSTDTPEGPALHGEGGAGAGAEMFGNRLLKNLRRLRRWVDRERIHCYRVYDADLPEYAVAVDLYEDWAHVQEYAPPRTVDPVRARRRLREVMAVVPEILEIVPNHVVLKVRRPQRGADQYQKLRDEGRFLQVREGDFRFLVNFTDYLDTGLFLDHRATRELLRELAPGRHFLNLFAYTGSGTVYAAAGGAASTTTVDLSPTYLDWARRNMELNGFSGSEHRFVRADCLEWLARRCGESARDAGVHRSAGGGKPRGQTYDLIFCDAPTFSNSKSMTAILDIQRGHAALIRAAAGLLSPDGILLFSTNFRRFKLDPAVTQEFEVADITKQTIPPDFARTPRIHTCFRVMPAATSPAKPAAGPRNAPGSHDAS
jgi:23S rRNA (guanine2445-N2)-methyltransferase / 23S rRNA (guanine2069-N7)-methyltransferase